MIKYTFALSLFVEIEAENFSEAFRKAQDKRDSLNPDLTISFEGDIEQMDDPICERHCVNCGETHMKSKNSDYCPKYDKENNR